MAFIEILEFDTNHFGIRIARMNNVTPEELERALDESARSGVKLLIHRCSMDNFDLVHSLEKHGFELMDTIVRFHLNLAGTEITSVPGSAVIRPHAKNEVDDIAEVARAAFAEGVDHFHCDLRLDRAKCDALYAEWARNSCLDRNLADEVLVAEMDRRVAGLLTLRLVSSKVGDGTLFGVAPQFQGKGVGKALMVAGINWCKAHDLEWMEEGTQVNNYASQSLWTGLGFRVYASWHTFHKWVDNLH